MSRSPDSGDPKSEEERLTQFFLKSKIDLLSLVQDLANITPKRKQSFWNPIHQTVYDRIGDKNSQGVEITFEEIFDRNWIGKYNLSEKQLFNLADRAFRVWASDPKNKSDLEAMRQHPKFIALYGGYNDDVVDDMARYLYPVLKKIALSALRP